MKKILWLVGVMALVLAGCFTTETGSTLRETREITGPVTSVVLDAPGVMSVTLDNETSLVIEGPEGIVNNITTSVDGSTLVVSTTEPVQLGNEPLEYFLSVPALEAMTLRASGDVNAGPLDVESLLIEAQSSGDVTVDALEAETLTVEMAGSGHVTINGGAVDTQRVTVEGSGEYNARALSTQTTDVTVASSGGAVVWAEEVLRIAISGSGDVDYYGEPQVTERILGSGGANNLGDR